MSTHVGVNTYTHSVTHVTEEMIRSLKQIIRLSGLSIEGLLNSWESVETGIYTWLSSKHLQRVTLEIFYPGISTLAVRWDFDIHYSYGSDDDGSLWADPDAIRYAIHKCGVVPANCKYEFVIRAPDGAAVSGWGPGSYRSTSGFSQHSVGNTIGANSLGSSTSYWRKAS
jgi:hypothetical protein